MDPVWGSVMDSVWGSVMGPVMGSVCGTVMGPVMGSVCGPVMGSVWGPVMDSVKYSVMGSVCGSVMDSVMDSVLAYSSSLFPNIKKWKYIEHPEGKNPFQPCIDLWRRGLVPSFDGKVWRIHAGKKAEVVWEGELSHDD